MNASRPAVALLALALACPLVAAPALKLPTLTDKQVEDFKAANSAASDEIAAQDPAGAAKEYQKAVALHDGNEGVWYNLACALALTGKTDAAMKALHHASDAGWQDASWPAKDSDLEKLHELPAFKEWLAGLAAPPADAPLELGATATDAGSLAKELDAANEQLDRVRPVLGSTELMRETRRISEWRVASWDAIAAGLDGAARADARMQALLSLTRKDYWPKNPDLAAQVERRANAFVKESPAAEAAPVAELIAALAEAQRETAEASELEDEAAQAEGQEAADAGLQRRLLVLAASHDDGPAVRASLVKLLTMVEDPRMERSLYTRLARLVPAEPERKEMIMAEARGSWFRLEGLPAFEAKTLDGKTITRDALKGRVVLIDFWATWCGPCKAELPHVKAAYERFKGDGFEIVGVSLDKAKDADSTAFTKWCAENGVTWPQVFDGKHWESALAKTFGVRSIPFPLLLDRDGRVIAADEQLRGESLVESIETALLASSAPVAVSGGQ